MEVVRRLSRNLCSVYSIKIDLLWFPSEVNLLKVHVCPIMRKNWIVKDLHYVLSGTIVIGNHLILAGNLSRLLLRASFILSS